MTKPTFDLIVQNGTKSKTFQKQSTILKMFKEKNKFCLFLPKNGYCKQNKKN